MSAFVASIVMEMFDDDSHAQEDSIECESGSKLVKTGCRSVLEQLLRNLVVLQLGLFRLDHSQGSICARSRLHY